MFLIITEKKDDRLPENFWLWQGRTGSFGTVLIEKLTAESETIIPEKSAESKPQN